MSRATLVDMQPEEETADTLENEEPVETQLQKKLNNLNKTLQYLISTKISP